jgi:type III restriction enzyme
MLERACGKLLNYDRVNVINDEAHHCYRHKVGADAEGALTGDDKKEAAENEEAARLWINGIEALDRKLSKGVRAVYDLSATPFFLRGSGYPEGYLFPWVVSDFSLMDAIESGIVKLPRVPVSDNLVGVDTVVYRDLWKHIGKDLPKTAAGAAKLSAFDLPPMLRTGLTTLYSHYAGEFERWERAGIGVPPVFIVVCQNTAISKLVFEWIAGFERGDAEEGERAAFHAGHLELFRNYDDQGGRLARPGTLLIDSRQIEAGDALDRGFREAAGPEIEQFKRELAAREGAGAAQGEASEAALLREVMNTVGRPGRLGEQIRCVVSVSMLTEGWDTNTVTHILGVRAFATQLLCEQVVGRGLRRQSYDLNPETGLFDVEYADIMGIPFDFAASPQVAKPTTPKPVTRVHAIKERAALEIIFPRVSGYRRDLPPEKLEAVFTEDSRLEITPADIAPTSVVMEGIVGAGVTITPRCWSACGRRRSASTSPSTCSTRVSATRTVSQSSTSSHRSSVSLAAGSTKAISSRRACPSARSSIRTSLRTRRRRSTSPAPARAKGASLRCSTRTIPRARPGTPTSSPRSPAGRPALVRPSATSAMSCSTVAGRNNSR